MSKDEVVSLEKLSVKELRRQAAIKNVPLQQIAAAVEKADLINLIAKAGPVLDQYDVSTGVKVHSAESIATSVKVRSKKIKNKKKRRRHSSSSSSRSSRSTRSGSRNRRKKKSKSRRRSRSRGGHRKRSRSRKSRSRSPSLVLVSATPVAAKAGPALPNLASHTIPATRALALPPVTPSASSTKPAAGAADTSTALKALPPVTGSGIDLTGTSAIVPVGGAMAAKKSSQHPAAAPTPTVAEEKPTIAQAAMAAVSAMGFDVLPKAPSSGPAAPAAGLRPSINSVAPAPYGSTLMPGGRICIQYLCTSRCDLGGNCPEAHIIDPEEEMRVRARFKEQECHYGAQCTRSGCLFRHPGEKFEEGQLVPEGQQVSLRVTPQGMALDFM